MKKRIWIGLFAVWAGFPPGGSAQVSTFPSPPPLASRTSQNSDTATNSPSSIVPIAPSATSDSDQNSAPSAKSPAAVLPPVTAGTSEGSSFLNPATNSAPATVDVTPKSASTLNSMTVLDDKVALQAGDRISFRVIEDRDDAVPRIVTDTGEIDFPYVGRMKVAGLTCLQVALQLKKLYEVDYYKRATVIVGLDVIIGHTTEEDAQTAWIVGQVRQVGPQELPKNQSLTVSQLILRAGGFGDFADEKKVRVVHRTKASVLPAGKTPEIPDAENNDEGQVVNVKSVFEGHSTFDPVVKPNDLIIVPKRLFNF